MSMADPRPAQQADAAAVDFTAPARAAVVNRTHRVVRAEATRLHQQRDRQRSLWIPVAVCSSLLLVVLYAAWTMFSFYDLTPNSGLPDASDQMALMLLWCLPVTAAAVVIVWRRLQRNGENTP